jgi:hypothetical protein
MEKLVAAIALVCSSSTVLAHDIYSTLRDTAGHLCCNGQDCKPVEATVLSDGNYYLPALTSSSLPTWQHHRLMNVSTNVSIFQWQMNLIPGVDQYSKTNLRPDASLLQ